MEVHLNVFQVFFIVKGRVEIHGAEERFKSSACTMTIATLVILCVIYNPL